jgi:hypothetical protein
LISGAEVDPDTPPDWLQVPQEFSNGGQQPKCFQFTDEHCQFWKKCSSSESESFIYAIPERQLQNKHVLDQPGANVIKHFSPDLGDVAK